MKRSTYQIINVAFLTGLLSMIIISCQKKKDIEVFNPSHMFTPVSVTVDQEDTLVKISWPEALYSQAKNVTYTIQVSMDSTFAQPALFSIVTNATYATLTQDNLDIQKIYFARIKADSANGSASSDWITSPRFFIAGIPVFLPVQNGELTDNAVILRWINTPGLTKIVLTSSTGISTELPLTPGDILANMKTVGQLLSNTTYKASIYVGTKLKHEISFTTKTSISGDNVIDLREITGRTSVLYDTLSKVPSGSVILLKRGATYEIPAIYTFDKSVTIMTGFGFGESARIIMTDNFDASGTIDSLKISDVILVCGGASYVLYVSKPAVIKKLTIDNCQTEGVYSNSFIRLKTESNEITNLYINNSVIDSFGISTKYAVIYANAVNSKFTNIEINNSTFYSFYYFIRQVGDVTSASVSLNNCTFNDMINQAGYFINFDNAPPVFTLSNSIFGKTMDPASSNFIKSSLKPVLTNCYRTADCQFSSNSISGATAYPGNASDLFRNPSAGIFNIKDNSFAGKTSTGDPRWR